MELTSACYSRSLAPKGEALTVSPFSDLPIVSEADDMDTTACIVPEDDATDAAVFHSYLHALSVLCERRDDLSHPSASVDGQPVDTSMAFKATVLDTACTIPVSGQNVLFADVPQHLTHPAQHWPALAHQAALRLHDGAGLTAMTMGLLTGRRVLRAAPDLAALTAPDRVVFGVAGQATHGLLPGHCYAVIAVHTDVPNISEPVVQITAARPTYTGPLSDVDEDWDPEAENYLDITRFERYQGRLPLNPRVERPPMPRDAFMPMSVFAELFDAVFVLPKFEDEDLQFAGIDMPAEPETPLTRHIRVIAKEAGQMTTVVQFKLPESGEMPKSDEMALTLVEMRDSLHDRSAMAHFGVARGESVSIANLVLPQGESIISIMDRSPAGFTMHVSGATLEPLTPADALEAVSLRPTPTPTPTLPEGHPRAIGLATMEEGQAPYLHVVRPTDVSAGVGLFAVSMDGTITPLPGSPALPAFIYAVASTDVPESSLIIATESEIELKPVTVARGSITIPQPAKPFTSPVNILIKTSDHVILDPMGCVGPEGAVDVVAIRRISDSVIKAADDLIAVDEDSVTVTAEAGDDRLIRSDVARLTEMPLCPMSGEVRVTLDLPLPGEGAVTVEFELTSVTPVEVIREATYATDVGEAVTKAIGATVERGMKWDAETTDGDTSYHRTAAPKKAVPGKPTPAPTKHEEVPAASIVDLGEAGLATEVAAEEVLEAIRVEGTEEAATEEDGETEKV